MVLVTPTAVALGDMGVTDSTFGVYGLAGTGGVLMNVVTETAALANLRLDNVLVQTSLFTLLSPSSIYSVGTIPVAPERTRSQALCLIARWSMTLVLHLTRCPMPTLWERHSLVRRRSLLYLSP